MWEPVSEGWPTADRQSAVTVQNVVCPTNACCGIRWCRFKSFPLTTRSDQDFELRVSWSGPPNQVPKIAATTHHTGPDQHSPIGVGAGLLSMLLNWFHTRCCFDFGCQKLKRGSSKMTWSRYSALCSGNRACAPADQTRTSSSCCGLPVLLSQAHSYVACSMPDNSEALETAYVRLLICSCSTTGGR